MAIITTGRYAAVASTLALVVALGGTSYAAVKINGKQLKNNSVTGQKIKDASLGTVDLSTDCTGVKITAFTTRLTAIAVGSQTTSTRSGETGPTGNVLPTKP